MRALRQRIAENRAAGDGESEAAGRGISHVRKPSVSTHSAFLPMLALWGFAVGSGSFLVLPPHVVSPFAVAAGLSGLGALAAPALAALAGLIACAIAVFAGIAFRKSRLRSAPTGSVESLTTPRFEPIDPASEFGSESLDAPIESEPFAGHPETETELADHGLGTPRELDLAEFAELPGRNAVWVEEVEEPDAHAAAEELPPMEGAPEAVPGRVLQPQVEEPERLSAIEKLRKTPPTDLSLIQMVERFAAALHERQEAANADPSARALPRRDAALAEALKALTVLSEKGLEIEEELGRVQNGAGADEIETDALRDTTRELRDALEKLRTLRGAA